ncbi:MAG TPA: 3-dehydroquinate synthase [Fibrobacteria bacterium]|jgi:3-dehydroquinate synthase/shikimate kinase/3-dehydroquinate synthase|nr:3-dehydroquinate synthase [Fibrobacteria bacterium]
MKIPLTRSIFFTGFMATGKSRIGSLTAASLGWKFYDTDKLIEERAGKSIPEIFAERGEVGFRELEAAALREICEAGPIVAALGGGTLLNPASLELARRHGAIVNLYAAPEVILERANRKKDSRPLLAGLDDDAKLARIKAMLADRKPVYELADFQFESGDDVPHHVLTRRIIQRLQVEELEPLWVELGARRYPIYIGEDLSDHAGAIAEKAGGSRHAVIVSDQAVKAAQGPMLDRLRHSLRNAPGFYWRGGEPEKTMSSVQKLITWMLRKGCSRKTVLFAFGGGVTGDMAGFAAAIFMRGADFVQVPTTLLAMVDSSVGGKTGVNHPLGKNMIGAFHQPRAVIISLAALSTLPREEYLAGLAEVAKYAVIKDPELFTYLEQNAAAVLAREPAALEHIIRTSCAIKAAVVGDDEREMGEGGRAILNYGHTFGHAFEFLAGYKDLPHGLAVALGMRCAARLSARLGLWTEAERARHDALLDALEFPRHFTGRFDAEAAWDATGRDKKADKGRRVFILPRAIGAVESVANPPKDDVMAAFASVIPYGGAA